MYTRVAEQLISHVISGKMKPGDRLPSENELAKQMGVSKSSVREALSALKLIGVLESRAGHGNYISFINHDSMGYVFYLLGLVEEDNPLELVEARTAVEVPVAGLAAKRATEEDIRAMEECLTHMEPAVLQDRDVLDADTDLHLSIARATHNDILVGIVTALHSKIYSRSWKTFKERTLDILKKRPFYFQQHTGIVAAIKARDVRQAKARMLAHLREVHRDFLLHSRSTRRAEEEP